jgi:hypothetical protein
MSASATRSDESWVVTAATVHPVQMANQELLAMSHELVGTKAVAQYECDRLNPVFYRVLAALDMDMRRFLAVLDSRDLRL